VIDAQKHGVEVREVDINYSGWDNRLETSPHPDSNRNSKGGEIGKDLKPLSFGEGLGRGQKALRLGFRQVKGLREEDIKILETGRQKMFTSINELRDIGIPASTLLKLADADAFRSIGLDRRQALWEVSTNDRPVALFKGQQSPDAKGENVLLPLMTMPEHVVQDYATLSLSVKAHPVSFLREKLKQLHIVSTADLCILKNGDPVKVAGLVLVRQRPGTAKGVVFISIEDETGTANLVVFSNIIEEYRRAILHSKLMMVEGKLQVEGEVIHVIVEKCYDLSGMLRQLSVGEYVFPEGRNFR
jgi:error-prone DNA polymerase